MNIKKSKNIKSYNINLILCCLYKLKDHVISRSTLSKCRVSRLVPIASAIHLNDMKNLLENNLQKAMEISGDIYRGEMDRCNLIFDAIGV